MKMIIRASVVAALALIAVVLGGTSYDWYQSHRAQENKRDRQHAAREVADCIVLKLSTEAKTSIAAEMHSLGYDPSDMFQPTGHDAVDRVVSASEKRCPNPLSAYGYVVAGVREQLALDAEFRTIEDTAKKQRQTELAAFDAKRVEKTKEATTKDAWMFKP